MINKAKEKWKEIGIAIATGLCIGFAIYGLTRIGVSPKNKPVAPVQLVADSTAPIKTESDKEAVTVILTKWIYNHSDNISMATSGEIARETLKTSNPLLMLSIMEVESHFDPGATSSKGAKGLTQVMPSVHAPELIKMGVIKEARDLYDISASIKAGTIVLDKYLEKNKNDVPKALEGYLGGRDGEYVRKILSNLANLYLMAK